MNQRKRRFACRAAFLAICAAPTLFLAGHIVPLFLPGRLPVRQAEASRRLGTPITFTEYSVRRPGISRFRGVELTDPGSGLFCLKIGQLTVAHDKSVLRLTAHKTEISQRELGHLFHLIEWRLLRGRSLGEFEQIQLVARDVRITFPQKEQIPVELTAKFSRTKSGSDITVDVRIVGLKVPGTIRIHATQAISDETSPTKWSFSVENGPLPCSLASPNIPMLRRLGDNCWFQGDVMAKRGVDGWDGKLSGWFSGIDLQRLVSDQSSRRLTGTAGLMIRQARFRGNRLEAASGIFNGGPGTVSQALVRAASKSLSLEGSINSRTSRRSESIAYRQLAFEFALDGSGCSIAWQCRGASPPAVLASQSGETMLAGPSRTIPLAGIVQLLVPTNDQWIPASSESAALLNVLPRMQAKAHREERISRRDGQP